MDIANDGAARVRADTHEVLNQPTPLEPYDAWATDTALGTGVEREAAAGRAPNSPPTAAPPAGRCSQPGSSPRTIVPNCRRTTATVTVSTASSTTPPTTS